MSDENCCENCLQSVCKGCAVMAHLFGEDREDDMTDVEADADTLKSAGWGTDEDYGYFGGEDF